MKIYREKQLGYSYIASGNIKQYNRSGRVQQFLKKQNMKCHASCPLHFEAFIPEDKDLYSHKTKQNQWSQQLYSEQSRTGKTPGALTG